MSQPVIEAYKADAKQHLVPSLSPGWLLLLFFLILPFILLALYNYPSIHDDYGNANNVLKMGPATYMQKLYLHWTGRYSEIILKAYLNPLIYQRTALLARVQPMVIIVLLVTGFCVFFKALVRNASASMVVACGLVATVVYLNGFEMVGAAIYWFGGYTSYTAGIISSLIAFAGMVALHQSPVLLWARLGSFLVAAVFSVIAVGTYDVSMMAMIWVVGSVAAFSWWTKHAARWWFVLLLLLLLVSVYSSMSAPGNQERALNVGRNLGQLIKSPRVVILLVKSVFFALTQSVSWSNSLLLLLGGLVVAGLLLQVPQTLPDAISQTPLVWLLLWVLAGLSATIFPSILVYQTVWAHSWQCVYLYFLMGWGWLLLVFITRYRVRLAWLQAVSAPRGWKPLAASFCGLCLFSSGSNTHLAYLDFLTNAPGYYVRVRQREQTIQTSAARQATSVELRPLYAHDDNWMLPKDLYTYDFSAGDAQQYVRYYGIDSVIVRPIPYHP